VKVSVAGEDVAGVDARGDVGEVCGGAVGEDGAGEALELGEVVDHAAAEECRPVLQRRFIDDYGGAFRLDAFHHTLYRRLAEVVGIRFHRQTVHPDNALALRRFAETVGGGVIVISRHFQHLVGDEVLAGAVALHDGGHHLLRHVGVVGQ